MNLFNVLVTEALKNRTELSSLRIVVEKELLHHEILRIMRDHHLNTDLTFIGGTCLRVCYGGVRLSEDLDFTGGHHFSRKQLSHLGQTLIDDLQSKYGLAVQVSEPVLDKQNVDTWKIKVQTQPESKHLPAQRINIDICALPSYEVQPRMLLNPYGVNLGTAGLIIQAQSREEIYADKLIAFAFRPNRIKYRDLWDIIWLHEQGYKPNMDLIPHKIKDRQKTAQYFLSSYKERLELLEEHPEMATDFEHDMRRFLPAEHLKTLQQPHLWSFITHLMQDFYVEMQVKVM